jgi:hypothetical protein
VRDDGPPEPELDAWIARFAQDRAGAARAYWEEIKRGFREGIGVQAVSHQPSAPSFHAGGSLAES